MSDLYLIGYTADLRHLVLDPDPTATSGRYWLAVDDDVLLTVDEVRELRREAGFDDPEPPVVLVGGSESSDDGPTDAGLSADGSSDDAASGDGTAAATAGADGDGGTPAADTDTADDGAGGEPAARDDVPDDRVRETGSGDGDVGDGADADRGGDEPTGDEATREDGDRDAGEVDEVGADSDLSPAEIQQQLRAGRSPSTVAERAGTDISWVERWLPPIVAEREQVLREAHAATLERQRLGRSERPLGDAVSANLADRSVDPDDVRWSTQRRKDGTWTVTVRYRSRGRARRASWRFDREAGSIGAASDLARELGFIRPRRRRSR